MNASGQKAYQRTDTEDRSLPYRNWLRTVDTNGFFMDVDFIKWGFGDCGPYPKAITDITRCDSDECNERYRFAITNRIFRRDKQGLILRTLGELLHVPVYLVLFQKEVRWLWVFDFQSNSWREYTPEDWATYLRLL